MPKGMPKKFRASWTNSYQRPRAAGLERLDEVSLGNRGQLWARTMYPPVVLPATAGSIVNFDRHVPWALLSAPRAHPSSLAPPVVWGQVHLSDLMSFRPGVLPGQHVQMPCHLIYAVDFCLHFPSTSSS